MNPERKAWQKIYRFLATACWPLGDIAHANTYVGRDVAVGEFPPLPAHGLADDLLY